MDPQGDRPPSEFEPPSRFGPGGTGSTTGPVTRADRMRAQIAALEQQAEAARQRVAQLSQPGPAETPQADQFGAVSDADRLAANQARRLREQALADAKLQANQIAVAARALQTDLANDPDAAAAAAARGPANVPTNTTEPFIVTRNPDGTLRQDPNPNYQGPKPATVPKGAEITIPARRPGQTTDLATVKNEADAYLANLNAQLANRTITAAEYGRLWDSYYQTTVKPKIDAANAEANAEAARQAQRQAEADRRTAAREDRATTLGELEFGRRAGQDAVSNALALLHYQVSPTFLREFAAGLGTLSSGGGHVAFSPEAFQIQLPDLNALAEQGAQRAAAVYRGTAGVPFTPQGAVAPAAAPAPAAAAAAPPAAAQALAGVPMLPRPQWDPASAGGPGSSPFYSAPPQSDAVSSSTGTVCWPPPIVAPCDSSRPTSACHTAPSIASAVRLEPGGSVMT
jgi:hypothetical protein